MPTIQQDKQKANTHTIMGTLQHVKKNGKLHPWYHRYKQRSTIQGEDGLVSLLPRRDKKEQLDMSSLLWDQEAKDKTGNASRSSSKRAIIPSRTKASTPKTTTKKKPSNDDDDDDDDDEEDCVVSVVVLIAKGKWDKVRALLETHPGLVSARVLLLALQARPPLELVECMLRMDPMAAAIPKTGPTALQVAIQYGASVRVVVRLLQACPFLLVVAAGAYPNALSLAKACRANEPQLLSVLSKPLAHWLQESNRVRQPRGSRPQQTELDNVKVMASTVLRSQKRQARALEHHKRDCRLTEELRQAMRTQLVALDMKEKAMRYQNRRTEERILRRLARLEKQGLGAPEHQKALVELERHMETVWTRLQQWRQETTNQMAALENKLQQQQQGKDDDDDKQERLVIVGAWPEEEETTAYSSFASEAEEPLVRKDHHKKARNKCFWRRF